MPVLTGIDLLGVQRYVFASNRLRDAVAASWLVDRATAPDGALAGLGGDPLMTAGGNAVIRFAHEHQAREFAGRYTRRLYAEAPGLEGVVVHRSYDDGELAQAIQRLQVDLACSKLERVPHAPQLGLSVNAACRVTGLPATGFDPHEPTTPLSPMVLRWRDNTLRCAAARRWDVFLNGDRFALPPEIDDMGRTRGDTSLIGVVHIDGNQVGRQITAWLHACTAESRSDHIVLDQLRSWSSALDHAGRNTVRAIIERTSSAIREDDQREPWLHGLIPDLAFQLRRLKGQTVLPVRPVLLGGDDLTFLCDGRIALDLAEAALDAFSGDIPNLGRMTSCAGIAIVPAHTPFDRAYELAEGLCATAKRRRHEQGDSGSWIDWHIGTPRPGESVENLRVRAYAHALDATKLTLTCRPYRLGAGVAERETWRWLSLETLGSGLEGFRGDRWRQHRSKLKELASVIREGTDGVKRARETWTVAGALTLPGGLDLEHGFIDAVRTPLLDAIELLDIHLPLSDG